MSSLNPRGVSVSCQCACNESSLPVGSLPVVSPSGADVVALGNEGQSEKNLLALGQLPATDADPSDEVIELDGSTSRKLRYRNERGITTYIAELQRPLIGSPLRVGEVWHLRHEEAKSLEPSTLSLFANGFEVKPDSGQPPLTVSWSPFSLVQACRLHSVQADAALPWLRLFKVSVFHHGTAHFFAARGEDETGSMRARWVADVARALRALTTSLFPPYRIRAEPVPGAAWTSTRLVAGYMLMCDNQDVALVYCELHTHWDYQAAFAVYEDECCDTRVMHVTMGVHTCISERVGVDCSCFSIDGHHFTARSSSEKAFWLRAISNVKVKLRHRADNPTTQELAHYRTSVAENARFLRTSVEGPTKPVLQRREHPAGGQGTGAKGVSSKEDSPSSASPKQVKSPGSSAATIPTTSGGGPGKMWSSGGLKSPTTPALPPQRTGVSPPPVAGEEPGNSAATKSVGGSTSKGTITPRSNACKSDPGPVGRIHDSSPRVEKISVPSGVTSDLGN